MSYGLLNKILIPQTTKTLVYTVPANCLYAEVDINVLNSTTGAAKVSVDATKETAPTAVDAIEVGMELPANGGVYVRESLKLSPGEKIFISSTVANVVARVSGILVTKI